MEKSAEICSPPPPPVLTRVIITNEEKETLTTDDILIRWKENECYIDYLERKIDDSKNTDEKLKLQQESARKENVLVMRLATKEQEMQELVVQIQELKLSQRPSATQLQNMLLDPAVNLLFEKMKGELTETKEKLEQAQNDLSAWKFTPDSVTGKKLMAKCRMLIQENQELGKQLSQGRIAQLEAELALQKKFSEELKGTQDEMNEFVIQLDEEVEGMQATICTLQQQLKESKTRSELVQSENEKLQLRIKEMDCNADESFTQVAPVSMEYEQQTNELSTNHQNDVPPLPPLSPHADNESLPTDVTARTTTFLNNIYKKDETFHPNVKTENKEEPSMGVDTRMDLNPSTPVKTEDFSNCLPVTVKHASVLQTSNEDSNDVDSSFNHNQVRHVSPNKFIASSKTSFSITDLLSDNKDLPRKEDASEINLKQEGNENGSTLNGAINDNTI